MPLPCKLPYGILKILSKFSPVASIPLTVTPIFLQELAIYAKPIGGGGSLFKLPFGAI